MWLLAPRIGAFLLLLLFPPFLILLQTRGAVWEEAVAYEYLYGILLVALLVGIAREPSWRCWIALCLLAGIGAFIRPTLVFYGCATLLAGSLVWVMQERTHRRNLQVALGPSSTVKAQPPTADSPQVSAAVSLAAATWKPITVGLALFCLGGALLFYTNLKRFGSGVEFGHRLNVQTLYGSLYATKFDDPYQDEPILSAASELFGALFRASDYNGASWYRQDFFPGQSKTVRWREFYFRTYDWSYVPMLLVAWTLGLRLAWRLWRTGKVGAASPLAAVNERGAESAHPPSEAAASPDVPILALWSLLATIPLAAFYLRNPVISSRYMMDFGPAFAAALFAFWLWLSQRCQARWTRIAAVLALSVWCGVELSFSESLYGAPRSVSWKVLKAQMQSPSKPFVNADRPGQALGHRKPLNAYDGAGWDPQSGVLTPLVTVFAHNTEFLELELELLPEPAFPVKPEDLRAKVQLEFLKRESIVKTERGWIVRFAGPTRPSYRTGIQTAFIATVPKQYLAEATTPWVLKRVSWRKEEGGRENAE